MKLSIGLLAVVFAQSVAAANDYTVKDTPQQITITTRHLEAAIRKTGYVSGVYRQTFLDRKTGFRDAGYGLLLTVLDQESEVGGILAIKDVPPATAKK